MTLPRFRFVCQELPSRLWQSWSQLLNFLKFSVSRPWFAKEPRENSARNVTSQVSEGLLQYLLLLFEVWTCLKRPEKFWASLGNQTFEILPKRDPRKVADTERKWHRSPTSSVFFVWEFSSGWSYMNYIIPVVPARGGAEVALKIYIRPFSSIELACAVRQPSPCVRALCESGVLFHMSHLKLHFALHASHSTLHTPHSTLHTPHFTLHASHCTLHTSHFTLHSPHFTLHSPHFTLHTPHFTLHTPHFTLHTALFTLHTSSHLSSSHLIPAHLFSSHLFSYVT